MDVTVTKKDLSRLVQRCQGVADKKSTMPVLSNVLLVASAPGELRVSATDLYVAVSSVAPAEVKKPGSIAVSAKDLFERIKHMPEGPIHITSEGGSTATLRSASSRRQFDLHGMPGGDFPNLPEPDAAAATLELELEHLAKLIARTQFSISTDETRAALNSALFEWEGDRVRMVTTDGHRLSKMELTVENRVATATMLLPKKAVDELKRLAADAIAEAAKDAKESKETARSAKASISQSGPNAFFLLGGARFSVKLVDAQFPPYAQVIPQKSERVIRAARSALADALDAVKLSSSDRTGGVRIEVAKGKMGIHSESPEAGRAFDELPVDYDGADVVIGFNAQYILDVLGALDGEDEVLIGVGGDLDPAVLRPGAESATSDFRAVVMPMRI